MAVALLVGLGAAGCGGGGSGPARNDGAAPPGAGDGAAGEGGSGGGGGGGAGGGPAGATRMALAGAFSRCLHGAVKDFQARATELETATRGWMTAADAAGKEAARAAFLTAMESWQVIEMTQVGPAAVTTMAGGQGLRDHIYSWPLVNPCAVETELVNRGYQTDGFPNALVNRRGLAALEYLLYQDSADSQCPQGPPAGWAALTADDREARRRTYAAAAAADVRRRAVTLADAWEPGKGGFADTLASAGHGNRVFPTAQAALNAVSGALFYLDGETKDMKVGEPLGLTECLLPACPESRFAHLNKANLRRNLISFRRISEGCDANFEGMGFDDLLAAVGAEPAAATLRQRGAAAMTALDAIEEPDIPEAVRADMASVRALHTALRGLTDMLKMEFKTLLDLEIPKRFEGDND